MGRMATPLSADKMVAALKKEGVKVVEKSGWRNHNRNHKGAWGGVNGIIIHHTAGTDSSSGLSLVYNGRSDLPGPLAHAYLGKDGTVTLTGNGRTNHAGLGDDDVLKAVIDEVALPKPNENNTDGNAHFYGIEIANLGNGKDPYPAIQYDAAVRWAAAICRAHGWTEKSVIGHKEWTNQKIDPSFSMTQFRKDVRARLTSVSEPQTQTPSITPGQYYIEAYRASSDVLSPGGWYNVTLTKENADDGQIFTPGVAAFGVKGYYQASIFFEFSGVPEGDEVQARLAERDSSGNLMKVTPIVEGVGTGGNTYFAYPAAGMIGAGRTVTIQVLNTTDVPVTLELVKIVGQWVRAA